MGLAVNTNRSCAPKLGCQVRGDPFELRQRNCRAAGYEKIAVRK
jgi:hypothetical protein